MKVNNFWMMLVFLLLGFSLTLAQEKLITGNVTDDLDLPLPGVNVFIKGTSTGTQTDFDGTYSISAAPGQVIVFSFIGQMTEERTVGQSNVINVQMTEDTQALEEVVVTALGIERKPKELSYSVQEVGGEEVNKTKAVNAATVMVGKVSGLQVNTTNNGVNPNTRVVLRGNRSLLGNNEALIVIDGYPSSRGVLDRINPSDIADISVLKGANASALYGSDAANGVILISTIKGKGKLNLTYTTSYQEESVSYMPELQDKFGAGGFPDGTLYPLENVNWGPRFDGRLVEASETYEDGRVWLVPFTPIKDNHKNFFNRGSTVRHGLTVQGGDDISDFMFSLDQTNVKGIVPKDTYNRTNVRLKASRNFEKFEIGGNFSFFRSHANVVSDVGGRQGRPLYWNVLNTPLHIPITEMKNWRTGEFTRNEVSYYRFYENPYFIVDTQREKTDYQEFTIIAHMKYDFTDWLNLNWRGGYTGGSENFKRELGAFTYAFHVPHPYSEMDPYGASVYDETSNTTRFNSDVILNITKDIDEHFSVNANIGQNIRLTTYKAVNVSGENLIIPDFYNVSSRTGDLAGGEESQLYRKAGVYGDLTIGFNDYLFLNVTARNDWSSALPKDEQSYFYPGGGISFVVSDAFPGIKGDKGLSYLKASFNITETGNDPRPYVTNPVFYAPNDNSANYDDEPYSFPYGSTVGLAQSYRESAPDLNPEFTTAYEAGLEFGLFKSRLNGNITLYQTNTTDQIVPINIAPSSGATSIWTNIGEIQNQGIEIDLLAKIFRNKDFKWEVGVNYSGFKSEVLSLTGGVNMVDIGGFSTAQIVAEVGKPYPQIRTTAYERDDQGRVIVGDDGDPIQSSELVTQGKTTPDYIIGLNTNIQFKNFSFYAVADYRTGHVFYNSIVDALEFTGLTKHSASSNREPFIFPNSSYSDGNGGYVANTDRPTSSGGNSFWDAYNDVKENYVTDATTLKIREVALTYNFDEHLMDKIGLQNLSIGVFGRNLFTFRPAENVYTDPEFNFTTGNAIGVGTQSQTPPTRQYGITLTAKF
ncbi:SusC/RagA family TonB-linked outer membrane protein [Abyssalbus ytuae]|uniref:SusC/RagA family TonB-linked outer membrane protein n=1 Tax=Abyssalbus ytuae TaxID=2926907 RepID=A0A9E7A2B1_9FLAO|nr:SusC/RagA family TonB-linked outer membrane protein [Abyssalbus ytuae]UOB18471.1 SusC/RagA family TonB-linked outer membrane protein [Abyssalbus ytuae]